MWDNHIDIVPKNFRIFADSQPLPTIFIQTSFVRSFLLLLIFLSLFANCNTKKNYKVVISSIDSTTSAISENIYEIKAIDDTSAFIRACDEYWLRKSVVMEVNKRLDRSDPVPF